MIKDELEVVLRPGPGEADGGRVIGKGAAVKVAAMSGLVGWKPQDRGSCLIQDVCLASLGVGVRFVLKGQWTQPKRETRSAREDKPAARGDSRMRVAKMAGKMNQPQLRTPS